jgi:Asp/Glu/hydantoin racemase
VGIAYVNVAGATRERTRLGEHVNAGKVVELVQAAAGGFDGVLVDSLFDTGVEISREILDIPVVGLFYPAASQAILVGGNFAILNVFVGKSSDGEAVLIEELAARYNVRDRMCDFQSVALASLPKDEDQQADSIAEIVMEMVQKSGASSVIVAGIHIIPLVNAVLKLKNANVMVIDASLSGLASLDGMLRQSLTSCRKQYQKSIEKLE